MAADIVGALGQVNPVASTDTLAYTCPTARIARVKVIFTELAGNDAAIRVAHVPAGESLSDIHYLEKDTELPASNAMRTSVFIVGPLDEIRVYADTANVAFNVNGLEQDQ